MPSLAVLDKPQTFPPKMFYPIVWMVTLALALYGLIFTPDPGPALFIWLAIGVVAVWQIWTIRWVQVDAEGIRIRNILQRGRELHWKEITTFHEEDVALNKRVYSIIDISNALPPDARRAIRIRITSDQVGFDALREIIREAVPKAQE
jgi:hypothetical protein